MSCNNCDSTVQTDTDPNTESSRNVISTDGDFELANNNATVIALAPVPLVALTFTLPENPRNGQSHRLVAAGATINVDGNGNTVSTVATAATVPLGSAKVYTFVRTDLCDPCEPGTWIPDCCDHVP